MTKRRRRKTRKNKQIKFPIEVFGIIIIFLSLIAIGQFGFIGIFSANMLRALVGETYAILAGSIIILGIYLIFKGQWPKFLNRITIGIGLIYLAGLIFFHWQHFSSLLNVDMNIVRLTWQRVQQEVSTNAIELSLGGGLIGSFLFEGSYRLFAIPGTVLLIAGFIFVGIMTIGNLSYQKLLEHIRNALIAIGNSSSKFIQSLKQRYEQSKKSQSKKPKERNTVKKESTKNSEIEDSEQRNEKEPIQTFSNDNGNDNQRAQDNKQPVQDTKPVEAEDDETEFIFNEEDNEGYSLPQLDLLNETAKQDQSHELSILEQNAQVLEETFQSFGVDAKVVDAKLGPAVTKYEIQPATGVKVSKIVSLSNDIALALAAKDIRMEAPIPGKSLIGIEVPNSNVSMVSFREVIEGTPRRKGKLLEVPVGRNIAGNIQIADLSKMPHLLIAGATGSGKSVGINGIICSILLKAKPNEVKLMMIDPKMVELNIYNGIPHLLTPVVTNPKKAAQALNKVVQEMERRYELFAGSGTRNMASYNEYVHEKNKAGEEGLNPLPYIVVIVDELADLMMVASNEVENAITRLAQMARAAGIHMILATQRPSVDVITGVVKANIPSRMAFAVSSGTDSRTILDSNGAEKLLGKGDMLYLPMGANKPTRVQGAFISDEEVSNIVEHVKSQQDANYIEEMIPEEPDTDSQGEPEDEYYQQAVEMVIEMQTASISLLQRRFRIGYNRAARLIDEMEVRGVVGPHEGSKPRVVLMETLPGDHDESISNEENDEN